MTIAQRIYGLIFTAFLGLAGLAGLAFVQTGKVFEAANFSTVNVVPSLINLDIAGRDFNRIRVDTFISIDAADPATRDQFLGKISELQTSIKTQLDDYEKNNIADDKDRGLLKEDRDALDAYYAMAAQGRAIAKEGKLDEARAFIISHQDAVARAAKALDAHNAYNVELSNNAAKEATDIFGHSKTQEIAIALVVIVIVSGMGIVIARRIASSLSEAVVVAETVAAGDLTAHIEVKSNDEVGKLLRALKAMNDSLVNIVGQVRSGTDAITTASAEIATGNMDLSSRTESQASSLEETAASMEELTTTVQQNSENAQQANQLALSASEVAVKGGSVVSEVVSTMGAINESSRKIVDIISVIDGIAFQTNILALNAAVEAARAGEQGRGFAVVATEVRNLAQRSAAAKEIKELINNSVEKVDIGTKLVDQAGATMQEVVDSVRRVTDIMAEINAASSEQSQGIGQVNQAVMDMDSVTQQNAALVEEAAAAAKSLQDQAGKLTEVVGVFKIDSRQLAQVAALHSNSDAVPVHSAQVTPIRNRAPARVPATARPARQAVAAGAKPVAIAHEGADGWEEF